MRWWLLRDLSDGFTYVCAGVVWHYRCSGAAKVYMLHSSAGGDQIPRHHCSISKSSYNHEGTITFRTIINCYTKLNALIDTVYSTTFTTTAAATMSRSEAHEQRNAQFREAFKAPFNFAATAPPTADIIPQQAKQLELAHTVDDIPNGQGARLHWLGNTKPDKVILYFHGES